MTTNRDLMIVGLAVTLVGIVGVAAELGNYTTLATTISASCNTYPYPAGCSSLYLQQSMSLFWFFVLLIPFAVGLGAFLMSFARGPPVGGSPQGRVLCPGCKTWQAGAFCPNDGTKLG